MNPRLTAVVDTISRVRNGTNPYEGGPFDMTEMMKVADTFSEQVQHDPFVQDIMSKCRDGEDITARVREYMSVVFAQGFSAGERYKSLEELEK